MIEAKAKLVSRGNPDWPIEMKDHVPMGKVYTVLPEIQCIRHWTDPETGKSGSIPSIAAYNADGTLGWFPLECLKLEDS